MITIACISDTHKQKGWKVPDADMLIHAGDLTSRGTHEEMFHELKWLGSLPHKYKLYTCGNHDWLGQINPGLTKLLCEDNNIIYLENSSVEILGFKIYGSPITPWFYDWAFNVQRGPEIKKYWDNIPNDTDILVTHGPPNNILDRCPDGYHAGCADLLEAVERIKPKLHIFGHIHDAAGQITKGPTHFINASICTEEYKPKNKPIVVEL